METFLSDLSFGVRTLRKSPAFAITALLTLALGIGASTAIFSVVNAVMLRPLPYRDADRLAIVTSDMRNRKVYDFQIAPGDLLDLRNGATQFSGLAGVATFPRSFTNASGEPEQFTTAFVTQNFLSLLGIPIMLGRDFSDEDATPTPPPPPGPPAPNAPPPPPQQVSVILTYDFWQRRFGGDKAVIGTVLDLGFNRATVVGVTAPGFELLFPPRENITRVPDMLQVARIDYATASRINVIFRLVGRLKPGATLAAAQTQLDAIGADLRNRFVIKKTAAVYFRAEPMREMLSADVKPALMALLGAVAFVLLIACANVANLILVRTSRRERELAVRAAFGGSRTRLVRQMLAESLVLGLGGAVLGLAVAKIGIGVLMAIGPRSLPNIDRVGLDAGVLAFAALAGLVAAALFGVVPALRASRPDLIGALRSAGRNEGLAGGHVLRNAVVMAEVTLAFVLLVGGGLMFRSFLDAHQHRSRFRSQRGHDVPDEYEQAPQPGAAAGIPSRIAPEARGHSGCDAADGLVPDPARWAGSERALGDRCRRHGSRGLQAGEPVRHPARLFRDDAHADHCRARFHGSGERSEIAIGDHR